MKTIITTFLILLGAIALTCGKSKEEQEFIEFYGWPMFKRTETVTLHDKVILRRPRKSDRSVAKLSYGGGMRESDRRSWMMNQG